MARIKIACTILALTALGLLIGAEHTRAATLVGPEKQAIIYDGDLELDSGGIKVVPWGSGRAEPVYDETYIGPQVLKVTSQGPYQGIVLQLTRPVNLTEFLSSGYGCIDVRILPAQPRLEVRRAQAQQARGGARATSGTRAAGGGATARGGAAGAARGSGTVGGGRGGGAGGGGAGAGAARGGGGARGGGAGAGAARGGGIGGGLAGARGTGLGGGTRGGLGTTRGAARGVVEAPKLRPGETDERALTARNLRLVLFTDKGMLTADSVPISFGPRDERGWVPVTIPLSALKGPAGSTQVRAVGVFSSESEVFYLARIRLIEDRRPAEVVIKAEPLFARPDKLITFTASLRGGPIDPIISWDFDKTNGIQQQAVGEEVRYLYSKPGDYLVTCTVTDKAGIRAPATATVGIKVE